LNEPLDSCMKVIRRGRCLYRCTIAGVRQPPSD